MSRVDESTGLGYPRLGRLRILVKYPVTTRHKDRWSLYIRPGQWCFVKTRGAAKTCVDRDALSRGREQRGRKAKKKEEGIGTVTERQDGVRRPLPLGTPEASCVTARTNRKSFQLLSHSGRSEPPRFPLAVSERSRVGLERGGV